MAKPKTTFLITAGPTVEDIDPVRFISNRATGKLGFAVAEAALAAGHRVILIHGPVSANLGTALKKLSGARGRLKIRSVRSSAEMYRAVMDAVAEAEVVIKSAAVSDFTPARPSKDKLKKSDSGLAIRLKPTRDILKALGIFKKKKKPGLKLIGFALETGSGKGRQRMASRLSEAKRKLKTKNADIMVLDTPAEMGSEKGTFHILRAGDGKPEVVVATKKTFAKRLVRLGLTELSN